MGSTCGKTKISEPSKPKNMHSRPASRNLQPPQFIGSTAELQRNSEQSETLVPQYPNQARAGAFAKGRSTWEISPDLFTAHSFDGPPPPGSPPPPGPPPPGPPPGSPPGSSARHHDDISRAVQASLKDQAYLKQRKGVLTQNLENMGLAEQPVPGDNNCQFHALSRQLDQNNQKGWTALSLRNQVVSWLRKKTNGGMLQMDLDGLGEVTTLKVAAGISDWSSYCDTMAMDGVTWGDELTLIAAAVIFQAEILIISSVKEDACNTITPPAHWKVPIDRRLIIGHYHEYHYISVLPLVASAPPAHDQA